MTEYLHQPEQSDAKTPPLGRQNIREHLKQELIDSKMIGVMIDPEIRYSFNPSGTHDPEDKTRKPHLKQNFARSNERDEFYHGRQVFKDADAYERYRQLSFKERHNLSKDDAAPYFTPDFLHSFRDDFRTRHPRSAIILGLQKWARNHSAIPLAHPIDIADQITLNPYAELAMQAETFIADLVAQHSHPRRVRHTIRSGHHLIYAAAENTRVTGIAGNLGFYDAAKKRIIAAEHNPQSNSGWLSELFAHEIGHATDEFFFQIIIHTIAIDEALIEATKKDIAHIEKLLIEIVAIKSGKQTTDVMSKELQRVLAHPKIAGETNTSLKDKLINAVNILTKNSVLLNVYTLPAKERYFFDPNTPARLYTHEDVGLYICDWAQDEKERIHKFIDAIQSVYPTREGQLNEVPAAFAQVSDPYGMSFARLVMPELYEIATEIQNLNPNIHDDPDAFVERLPKMLAKRAENPDQRKNTQTAWLNRLEQEKAAATQRPSGPS